MERRPAWLAAAEAGPSGGDAAADDDDAAAESEGEGGDDERSAEEQEASRKEWLQYYMQTSEWQKASELVVTDAEREDLEYLREREERQQI